MRDSLCCLLRVLWGLGTGMVYGMQNKLETLARVCGDREDPKFVQNCWCDDLGKEGQLHPSSNRIAKECGYSLRLWFYPCNGTDAAKVSNHCHHVRLEHRRGRGQ